MHVLPAMGGFSYGDVDWLAAANNILLSFPITAHTAFLEPPLDPSWLLIELNPAPGSLAGWYEISQNFGLNFATPYSSVGGLGNYGPSAVIAVGLGLGILLAYFDGRVGQYIRAGLPFVAVAVVAMSAVASVTALQYSTRTFTRLLLYLLVAELATRLWKWNRDELAARRQEADERAAKRRAMLAERRAAAKATG